MRKHKRYVARILKQSAEDRDTMLAKNQTGAAAIYAKDVSRLTKHAAEVDSHIALVRKVKHALERGDCVISSADVEACYAAAAAAADDAMSE